jgi:hypothetical protein
VIVKDPPDASLVGQEVTAAGTVKIQTSVSGGGDVKQYAELSSCTITPASGGGAGSGGAGSGSAK